MALRGPLQFDRVGSRLRPLFPSSKDNPANASLVRVVADIGARHAVSERDAWQAPHHAPLRNVRGIAKIVVALFPCAESSAQENQLTDVIRVVVGCEQNLPEDGLTVAVGNFCE